MRYQQLMPSTPTAPNSTTPISPSRCTARLGLCIPGSLIKGTTHYDYRRGGRTNTSYLHGPYPSWIRKAGTGPSPTRSAPPQLERYRPLFDNTKRLRELIGELETLSAQAIEHAKGWAAP